jgi:alpha/beta superfamily hydrolase
VSGDSLRLRAADGVEVAADIWIGDGAWAGAVVCHPHPAYGGDRHNMVVDRICRTLAEAGATVLRFDFRSGAGAGGSEGGERLDAVAGLDAVAAELPPGVPLWLVGYSFGADIALSVDDARVAGWAVVAPPLQFGNAVRPAAGDPRPVLVVAAEHDRFAPPDQLRAATATWPDVTLEVATGADHFLAGATDRVAATILPWLRDRSGPAPT